MAESHEMKTQKITLILMWVAYMAIIVFCTVGIAIMVGWMPASHIRFSNVISTGANKKSLDNDCALQSKERDIVRLTARTISAQYLVNSTKFARNKFIRKTKFESN